MATPEGRVKAQLDRMLSRYPIFRYSPQAGIYGAAGIPDRVLCVGGRFVGIEAKADAKHKPTRLQLHSMAQIERAGGKCFVVYDEATIAEVELYIQSVLADR